MCYVIYVESDLISPIIQQITETISQKSYFRNRDILSDNFSIRNSEIISSDPYNSFEKYKRNVDSRL